MEGFSATEKCKHDTQSALEYLLILSADKSNSFRITKIIMIGFFL